MRQPPLPLDVRGRAEHVAPAGRGPQASGAAARTGLGEGFQRRRALRLLADDRRIGVCAARAGLAESRRWLRWLSGSWSSSALRAYTSSSAYRAANDPVPDPCGARVGQLCRVHPAKLSLSNSLKPGN